MNKESNYTNNKYKAYLAERTSLIEAEKNTAQ